MNVWHYEQRIMIIKNDYGDLKENRTLEVKREQRTDGINRKQLLIARC